MSIVEMSSRKNAPVPETTYRTRPATAMLLVFATLHKSGKQRLVTMMKSAGRLTMNWIMRSGLPEKCAFTAQSAGAIAAPAITVKRLIERIVNVNRPEICLVCIKS